MHSDIPRTGVPKRTCWICYGQLLTFMNTLCFSDADFNRYLVHIPVNNILVGGA